MFFHKYFNLQNVKKAREARQTAKTQKSKTKKKKESKEQPEEQRFLESDGDLESLESLDVGGDEVDADDIDEMFASPRTDKHQSKELFDYSDLLQDVQNAYKESIDEGTSNKIFESLPSESTVSVKASKTVRRV